MILTKHRNSEGAGKMEGPYNIGGLEFINSVRDKTRSYLMEKSSAQTLKAGQIIFMHQDPADRFYYIKTGWIKLFRETLDGDEAILDVLPAGSVFGETSFFEEEVYSYSAEVIEDCEIVSFPVAPLLEEVRENGQFALDFLKHLARRSLVKDKEIELRSVQNASQRIGCFLLRLCHGKGANSRTLHLSWEKAQIAARLGMTPETFSRSLAKLEDGAGIRIQGSTIEIPDINALVRYTCASCSDVFPCGN